jgi:hypothetical protein
VGALVKGLPRPAAATVSIAGVRTNFALPDLLSIGQRFALEHHHRTMNGSNVHAALQVFEPCPVQHVASMLIFRARQRAMHCFFAGMSFTFELLIMQVKDTMS